MRRYEATLYERPKYGDPAPVMLEGSPVSREIVAETAGKARYSFYLYLREAWGDSVRFQDIRVKSLAKRKAPPMFSGWESRLDTANKIVRIIASCGRRFFSENSDRSELKTDPFIAHFKVDAAGELWFVDRYTRKPVLVRHNEWPGFSDGGTLRAIVQHLAEHITVAKAINLNYFGPFPKSWCDGDLWGYGEDMPKVRRGIEQLLSGAQA